METKNNLLIFINELRKSVRALGLAIAVTAVVVFLLTPRLLELIQGHLAGKLYFFTVAGPFLAHAKLALFIALFILMPWMMTVLWKAMAKPFGVKGLQLWSFIVFTCLLFYAGTLFCYFVTLPLGITFLLGYGSEELQPVISISRFVNFTTLFILAFGLTFELPIFMVFLAKVKVFSRSFYAKNRKYAVLLIAIIAALLTPTPDVINMSLMGVPLYLLYESGIVILRLLRIP